MALKDWSTTAATNATIASNSGINWQEGQAPSTINDSARAMMTDVAAWYQSAEWIDLGHTPTYATGTTFTVPGDNTSTYTVGRRVKITNSVPTTFYATVTASSYSTNTTVTVTNDGSALSGTLSSVSVGIINPTNSSEIRTHSGAHTFSGDVTSSGVNLVTGKQATLVSGTNIKTVGGISLLGSGDISVGTGDVTLSGTQALTNKTVALGSNTVSGTLAQFNAACTDADFVSLTGAETLTNKTLTSPVVNEGVYNLTGTDFALANGSVQYKTLTANTTFTESLADGQSITLMLNPATYTVTWPTTTWVGSVASTAPTLVASVYNCITFFQFAGTFYGKYEGRV